MVALLLRGQKLLCLERRERRERRGNGAEGENPIIHKYFHDKRAHLGVFQSVGRHRQLNSVVSHLRTKDPRVKILNIFYSLASRERIRLLALKRRIRSGGSRIMKSRSRCSSTIKSEFGR